MKDMFGNGEEIGNLPARLIVEKEEARISASSNLPHLNTIGRIDNGT